MTKLDLLLGRPFGDLTAEDFDPLVTERTPEPPSCIGAPRGWMSCAAAAVLFGPESS
jgi:hypothetical protein